MQALRSESEPGNTLLELANTFDEELTLIDSGKSLPPLNPKKGVSVKYFTFLKSYVEAPTITDSYGSNHELRVDSPFLVILLHVNKDLYAWYKSNRLAYNNLTGILLSIQHLPTNKKTIKLISQLQNIIPATSKGYDKLSVDEKVTLSKSVAQLAEKVYFALGK